MNDVKQHMEKALQMLNHEHAGLWRTLITLEKLGETAQHPTQEIDFVLFNAILNYLGFYNQHIHYPKENGLFHRLLMGETTVGNVIEELQANQRQDKQTLETLRGLLADLEAEPDNDPGAFASALSAYIEQQRQHIRLEDRIIIPESRHRLSAEDWAQLSEQYKYKDDDPLLETAVRDEYRELYRIVSNYAPEPLGLGLKHRLETKPVKVILETRDLSSAYGRILALKGVDISVCEGELVALVGANGAGKSTLLRTLSGVQPASSGSIHYYNDDITRLPPDKRVKAGIAQVPEGRQMFGPMSVEDNLLLGGVTRKKSEITETLVHMYDMFPILKQKRTDQAGTLSGGQQQMLAIARALMANPRLLLLDEPSMGLAPLLVDEIFNTINTLKEKGISIFLVEQNAYAALSIADRGYVLETGQCVLSDSGGALLANDEVRKAYLGL